MSWSQEDAGAGLARTVRSVGMVLQTPRGTEGSGIIAQANWKPLINTEFVLFEADSVAAGTELVAGMAVSYFEQPHKPSCSGDGSSGGALDITKALNFPRLSYLRCRNDNGLMNSVMNSLCDAGVDDGDHNGPTARAWLSQHAPVGFVQIPHDRLRRAAPRRRSIEKGLEKG